jgi:hypothetical protein
MTSFKQIEANRQNALKSTGPRTEAGKCTSRCNAVRHGLTAETIISALEDAEDYRAFEATITADYDAQSAVERELVLRLASLFWRLRRATMMETGLFDIQARHLQNNRKASQSSENPSDVIHALFGRAELSDSISNVRAQIRADLAALSRNSSRQPSVEFAQCFLRLANLPNFALDRLSRYEVMLWRQVGRILFALDELDRRKPQERTRRSMRRRR